MSWNLNSERPIYAQLMERITLDIISGIYPPGSKLPSVRDLAQDAGVNPNTMQKALSNRTAFQSENQRTFCHGGINYDRKNQDRTGL